MKNKVLSGLISFFMLTLGTALMSSGIYFFKFPNNFSTGGVSGISVLLGAVIPGISPGTLVLVINGLLLFVGFIFVGKNFGIKTVYCSSLMSVLIFILERICPLTHPLTSNPLLDLVYAILLPAVGSALLFNLDASTGGTDIIAMIIKKYSSVNISKALFIADSAIVMLTFFVFGTEIWLYSLLGFLAKVFMVNSILENINMSKYCTVVAAKEQADLINGYITEVLHKTATVSDSFSGAFTNDSKCLILVALNRRQTILLKKFVKELGKKTFIIVTNTSDICGKGFREVV